MRELGATADLRRGAEFANELARMGIITTKWISRTRIQHRTTTIHTP
jgi:hypothetical protein